jgi:hypothetical protein
MQWPKAAAPLWGTHTDLVKQEFVMTTSRVYSQLFSCLHDEPEPVGHLGRGTHYSVFRSVQWRNPWRSMTEKPSLHDFAVVWDEDHDTRVIRTIEEIYMADLLSPVLFIGERKGALTVLVEAKFWFAGETGIERYKEDIYKLAQNACHGDCWTAEVGFIDPNPECPEWNLQYIIHAEERRVLTYLRNIQSLWNLGHRPFEPSQEAEEWAYPEMRVA